jgi:hypothetical protein
MRCVKQPRTGPKWSGAEADQLILTV